MKNSTKFSHELVKGKIAETLFEQMYRDTKKFTVLAFGYESVLPELAQRQHDMHAEETMEVIRRAPDFAVIDIESHEVHLVEVKYMMHMYESYVLKAARRMCDSWKPSYLFIATPKGFFCDKVIAIVENKGRTSPLNHPHIPAELQEQYIKLLNEFIVPHD